MSLQGSLETFALPDVLVLLASTKKSGELRVQGGRGEGRVWVQDGEIVQTHFGGKDLSSLDTVFELLRISSGNFSFATGEAPSAPHEPELIDGVLAEAQDRLAEWREIEKVVPRLDVVLDMAPEAPDSQVTVTADQWKLLVAVAGGRSVAELMTRIARSEFDTCKAVKGLVEARLISLDANAKRRPAPAPAPSPAPAPARDANNGADTPDRDGAPADGAADAEPEPAASAGARQRPPRPVVRASTTTPGTVRSVTARPAAASGASRPEAVRGSAGSVTPEFPSNAPDDPAAAGRSAARASRAASAQGGSRPSTSANGGSSTPGSPGAPGATGGRPGSRSPEAQALVAQLAALGNDDLSGEGPDDQDEVGSPIPEDVKGEEDEQINRGLLLKFLSSVRN